MVYCSLRTDSDRHIAIRLFFLRCFFHGETDQIDRCLTNSFDPEKIAVTDSGNIRQRPVSIIHENLDRPGLDADLIQRCVFMCRIPRLILCI